MSFMCKMKDAIVNSVRRWVPKEKMDKAKMEKSACRRVNVFKRLTRKVIIKNQDKAQKISHVIRIRNEGRNVAYKVRNDSNKIRY